MARFRSGGMEAAADNSANDMSAVCILAPVVITSWPVFSAAVAAAAASLGYKVAMELSESETVTAEVNKSIHLEIPQSEIVTSQLNRHERVTVVRNGITVTFARDLRGRATLCVRGEGRSETALREKGEELSQRVVQQYVYRKLLEECRQRQFTIVEETVEENQAIRLIIRHWEN